MKQKEIKNLAKKIWQLEKVIQNPESTKEQKVRAEAEITRLSAGINSFEDMVAIDEAIQDLLDENS